MDLVDENAVNIYTDGASYSHPRRGGIGIRFVYVGDDGHEVAENIAPQGFRDGTNQEMELRACIEALAFLRKGKTAVPAERFEKILIHSDSQYVVNSFNTALHQWQANRWHTRDGAPVVNAKLWKDLIHEYFAAGKRVNFVWVKGHRDSPHNKAADKLAKQSANLPLRDALHVGSVRRKQTDRQVDPGCVVPAGQRLTVRIVSDRYLPLQRCTQYRYEVVSKASPFHGLVDLAFSEHALRPGHTYFVRLNTDRSNPRIEKVFREVTQ